MHNEESSTRASIRRVGMVVDLWKREGEGGGREGPSFGGGRRERFSSCSRVQSKRGVEGKGRGVRGEERKVAREGEERRSWLEDELEFVFSLKVGTLKSERSFRRSLQAISWDLFITGFLSCSPWFLKKEKRTNPSRKQRKMLTNEWAWLKAEKGSW